jgi:hypothetical protein
MSLRGAYQGVLAQQAAAAAPQGPAAYGSVAAWHDASVVGSITQIANEMTAWADQSGNGVDLIAFNSLTRPPMNTRTMNGIAVPEFQGVIAGGEVMHGDGTHQILNVSDGTITLMGVCYLDDISDSNNIISMDDEGSSRGSILRVNHRPEGLFFRSGESTIVHSSGSTYSDNAVGVATMIVTTSTVQTWWNNVGTTATSYSGTAAPTFVTNYALGGRADPTPSGNLDGLIAEAIAWTGAISDVDRKAMELSLATKWGLSTTPWD